MSDIFLGPNEDYPKCSLYTPNTYSCLERSPAPFWMPHFFFFQADSSSSRLDCVSSSKFLGRVETFSGLLAGGTKPSSGKAHFRTKHCHDDHDHHYHQQLTYALACATITASPSPPHPTTYIGGHSPKSPRTSNFQQDRVFSPNEKEASSGSFTSLKIKGGRMESMVSVIFEITFGAKAWLQFQAL